MVSPSRPLIVCLLPALLATGCTKGAPAPGQADPATILANATSPDEAAPATSAPAAHLDRSHAGAAMPTVAFQTLEGEPATLALFQGKPLLVNLWATWCAPCRKEMPTLDALAASGAVRVLPVSQDLDGAAKVRPYLAQARFKALRPALDPKLALSLAYQANLPTSILYGSDGKEVWRYTGDLDWTGAQAKALLAEAR